MGSGMPTIRREGSALSPKPLDLAETVDGRSLLDDLIEFFDRFIDAREDDLLTAGSGALDARSCAARGGLLLSATALGVAVLHRVRRSMVARPEGRPTAVTSPTSSLKGTR